MRFSFLTATPLNVIEGSGTFAGIATLARALRRLDVEVEIVAPGIKLPGYTMRRLWFNEQLRNRRWDRTDAIVGFDMDGYRIAGSTGLPHVAVHQGGHRRRDALRARRHPARACPSRRVAKRAHVRRADLVIDHQPLRRRADPGALRGVHGARDRAGDDRSGRLERALRAQPGGARSGAVHRAVRLPFLPAQAIGTPAGGGACAGSAGCNFASSETVPSGKTPRHLPREGARRDRTLAGQPLPG